MKTAAIGARARGAGWWVRAARALVLALLQAPLCTGKDRHMEEMHLLPHVHDFTAVKRVSRWDPENKWKFLVITENRGGGNMLKKYLTEHFGSMVKYGGNIGTLTKESAIDPKKDVCYKKTWHTCYKTKFEHFYCGKGFNRDEWCDPIKEYALGSQIFAPTLMEYSKFTMRAQRGQILAFMQTYFIKPILLFRRNRLRHLISVRNEERQTAAREHAKSKGMSPEDQEAHIQAVMSENGGRLNLTEAYEPEGLVKMLDRSHQWQHEFCEFFASGLGHHNGKHYLWMWFEDLTDAAAHHKKGKLAKKASMNMKKLLAFLAFPNIKIEQLLSVPVYEEVPIRDLVTNMDEVRLQLRGTRYEMFIDDLSRNEPQEYRYAKPATYRVGPYVEEKSFIEKPLDWKDHMDAWKARVGQAGLELGEPVNKHDALQMARDEMARMDGPGRPSTWAGSGHVGTNGPTHLEGVGGAAAARIAAAPAARAWARPAGTRAPRGGFCLFPG